MAHIFRQIGAGLALAVLLAGCDTWQPPAPTAAPAAQPAPQLGIGNEANFEIESRAALNPSGQGSLPVMLRIYMLRRAGTFEQASASQLLGGDRQLLQADWLGSSEVTLSPGRTARLSLPIPDGAHYVGVVAFFHDQADAEWQLVIPATQWQRTNPVKLVVFGNQMEMEPGR